MMKPKTGDYNEAIKNKLAGKIREQDFPFYIPAFIRLISLQPYNIIHEYADLYMLNKPDYHS